MKRNIPWPIWGIFILIVLCFGASLGAALPHSQETYPEAKLACATSETSPWDVHACQWDAYEKFFGPEAANAAWVYSTK